MHAGFLKRLFAAIIDTTLVIILTWLLYLFPFKTIIGNAIDSDYKTNIETPNEEISEQYSGSSSLFGTTTEGYYTILKNLYTTGYMSEDEYNAYVAKDTLAYNNIIEIFDNLTSDMALPYDSTVASGDQLYSKLYTLYTHCNYSYSIRSKFLENENYVLYSSMYDLGLITSDEQTALESEYSINALRSYVESLKSILVLYNEYNAKNEGIDITSLYAYRTVKTSYNSACSSLSKQDADFKAISDTYVVENLPTEATSEMVTTLKNYVEDFRTYQVAVTVTNMTTQVVDGATMDNITEEIYYIFYYGLATNQFISQLPYYEKVYNHSTWAVIYSLAMFTLIFSLYTSIMRGQTLGRRGMKIKMTTSHEKDKLNPVLALLHDVPFRFLYVILIGMFSLYAAIIVFVIFMIADAIMVRFTKDHRCIRDILSATKVIETPSY